MTQDKDPVKEYKKDLKFLKLKEIFKAFDSDNEKKKDDININDYLINKKKILKKYYDSMVEKERINRYIYLKNKKKIAKHLRRDFYKKLREERKKSYKLLLIERKKITEISKKERYVTKLELSKELRYIENLYFKNNINNIIKTNQQDYTTHFLKRQLLPKT